MSRLLVVTSEPITAAEIRGAVDADVDPAGAEVMIVAPALHESPVKFWLSDADEAIARAEQVRRETLAKLGDENIPAAADTGEGDPIQAIEDALSTFAADRIVLFRHPEAKQRYREDVDPEEIRERFGVPVDLTTVNSG